jgi:hypothetical protein
MLLSEKLLASFVCFRNDSSADGYLLPDADAETYDDSEFKGSQLLESKTNDEAEPIEADLDLGEFRNAGLMLPKSRFDVVGVFGDVGCFAVDPSPARGVWAAVGSDRPCGNSSSPSSMTFSLSFRFTMYNFVVILSNVKVR